MANKHINKPSKMGQNFGKLAKQNKLWVFINAEEQGEYNKKSLFGQGGRMLMNDLVKCYIGNHREEYNKGNNKRSNQTKIQAEMKETYNYPVPLWVYYTTTRVNCKVV